MKCKICNDEILPKERYTEAGLDYCMKPECLKKGWEKPKNITVVMVHKQGFNVLKTEEAAGQNFMDPHGRLI